jgi:hypothetical protein
MESYDTFLRWLAIREENGFTFTTVQQLKIDAEHSSLLSRLRDGGDVFPEPPPRSYSAPWCDLIKTGLALPFEVYYGPDLLDGPDAMVINQCSEWKILERLGEDQFIATYQIPDKKVIAAQRATGKFDKHELPMRLSDSRWKVYAHGMMVTRPERQQWVIERLQ